MIDLKKEVLEIISVNGKSIEDIDSFSVGIQGENQGYLNNDTLDVCLHIDYEFDLVGEFIFKDGSKMEKIRGKWEFFSNVKLLKAIK